MTLCSDIFWLPSSVGRSSNSRLPASVTAPSEAAAGIMKPAERTPPTPATSRNARNIDTNCAALTVREPGRDEEGMTSRVRAETECARTGPGQGTISGVEPKQGLKQRADNTVCTLTISQDVTKEGPWWLWPLDEERWGMHAKFDEEWTLRALCAQRSPDELFVRGAAQRQAREICFDCPVRWECLVDALDNRIQ